MNDYELMKAIIDKHGPTLKSIGSKHGVELDVVAAVIAAESGSLALHDGRMVIRFEAHIFWREWGIYNQNRFKMYFSFDLATNWKGHAYQNGLDDQAGFVSYHGNQDLEYDAFSIAKVLDLNAACKSISMGVGQVMGFNHKLIGYRSAVEMFEALSDSVDAQIKAIFDYAEAANAIGDLQQRNWHAFAVRYNGSGQAGTYADLIQRHYRTLFDAVDERASDDQLARLIDEWRQLKPALTRFINALDGLQ